MNPTELAAWVAASCRRHGVPVKVTDAGVIVQVAVLLGGGTARSGSGGTTDRTERPTPSEPPHDVHPARVHRLGATFARSDDNVVNEGFDDGVLSAQVEVGPLSA